MLLAVYPQVGSHFHRREMSSPVVWLKLEMRLTEPAKRRAMFLSDQMIFYLSRSVVKIYFFHVTEVEMLHG